jgi:hypothetical protein
LADRIDRVTIVEAGLSGLLRVRKAFYEAHTRSENPLRLTFGLAALDEEPTERAFCESVG